MIIILLSLSLIASVADGKLLQYPLKSKRQVQKSRSLQTFHVFDDEDIDGLYQGKGVHYVNLHVGCPPQLQTVIVNTGSTFTGFPCSECNDCGENYQHTNPFYQESESTCFGEVSCSDCSRVCSSGLCRIRQFYGEGDGWEGREVEDRVAVGGDVLLENDERFLLRFACQDTVTGLFETQLADSIMGLSRSSSSFWSQMHNQGAIDRPHFSLCYRMEDELKEDAGIIVFGGTDIRLHETKMAFAELAESDMWKLKIRKMYLGESEYSSADENDEEPMLEISPGSNVSADTFLASVVSGTTHTYLSAIWEEPIQEAWNRWRGEPLETSYLLEEEVMDLPTLFFQFEGLNVQDDPSAPALMNDRDQEHPNDILVAFPSSRLFAYDSNTGRYNLRLYFNGESNELGANFISGHDVLFDVENNRIGFAESDCSLDVSDTYPPVREPIDSVPLPVNEATAITATNAAGPATEYESMGPTAGGWGNLVILPCIFIALTMVVPQYF